MNTFKTIAYLLSIIGILPVFSAQVFIFTDNTWLVEWCQTKTCQVDPQKNYTLSVHPLQADYYLLFEEGNLFDSIPVADVENAPLSKKEPPLSQHEYNGFQDWANEINSQNWQNLGAHKTGIQLQLNSHTITKDFTDVLIDLSLNYRSSYEFAYFGINYLNRSSYGPTKNELFQRLWRDSDPEDLLDTNYIPQSPFGTYSFGFEVGIPFVLFGFQQKPYPIPEFLWIDENIGQQINERIEGNSVLLFKEKKYLALENNWAGYLVFQFEHFQYRIDIDHEIYQQNLHTWRVIDLPLFSSHLWGGGLLAAPSGIFPFINLDFGTPPLFENTKWGRLLSTQIRTNLDLYFRNSKHYLIQLGVSINMKDPYEYFK